MKDSLAKSCPYSAVLPLKHNAIDYVIETTLGLTIKFTRRQKRVCNGCHKATRARSFLVLYLPRNAAPVTQGIWTLDLGQARSQKDPSRRVASPTEQHSQGISLLNKHPENEASRDICGSSRSQNFLIFSSTSFEL